MESKYYQITDQTHPQAGQIGRLVMIYYDYRHTGDSADLLNLEMDDGIVTQVKSTQAQPARRSRADESCPACDQGIMRFYRIEKVMRCDCCDHEMEPPVDRVLRHIGAPTLPGLEDAA